MLESWKRKEWQHTLVWGMSHFFTAESERPEFEGASSRVHCFLGSPSTIEVLSCQTTQPTPGELRPSLVDGTSELYYSDFQRRINTVKSSLMTTGFIVVNVAVQILIFTVRTVISVRVGGRTKQFMLFASSLVTSVQINFADGLVRTSVKCTHSSLVVVDLSPRSSFSSPCGSQYKQMAIWLTDLENHRLDSLYYDSLILKFSTFQLFNNYSSLFYIGFVKPYLGLECQVSFQTIITSFQSTPQITFVLECYCL
jgi:hypothetical protein